MTGQATVSKVKAPVGWVVGCRHGSGYEGGTDTKISHSGCASGYLRSKTSKPKEVATLVQTFGAEEYRGKRLQMSAYVKADKIKNWAGLWMRVDSRRDRALSFDNMQNRPIKGTCDWAKHAIVLDVPDESISITFGVLLDGQGRVWVDDFQFDVVTTEVPTTGKGAWPKRPRNLDFEEQGT
jgi:hypothetical protein